MPRKPNSNPLNRQAKYDPAHPLAGLGMKMSRVWSMPCSETFKIPAIKGMLREYVRGVSIDPYARDAKYATYTNDLNPSTSAEYHLDATEFLTLLKGKGVQADAVIVDPPYSPRQVKECYDSIGRKMEQGDALSSIKKKLKEAIVAVLKPGGAVLTFGWNSVGMGKGLGFEIIEIMLVCHGSDHNDTICLVERKLS